MAPYPLVRLLEWEDSWNPFFLFVTFISMGALAVSGFFIWAPIAGLNLLLRLDKLNKTFTYLAETPIVSPRKYEYPIASIEAVDIDTHDRSNGSPGYSLKIKNADGHRFKMGSSWSRAE